MQLAQLNIAHAKYDNDDPRMADFTNNIAPVNAIAEQHAGFVWRFQDALASEEELMVFADPRILVNMSVWQSLDALKDFMFKTHHLEFMKRKHEWFHKMDKANQVMWWVEDGHIPTLAEAKARLMHLHEIGESAAAFTFRSKFEPEVLLLDEVV